MKYKKNTIQILAFVFLSLFLSACGGLPKGIDPVSPFDSDRYLGQWYEIARLDHKFERGLSNVSAHYSLRDNGTLKVVNRGFDDEDQEWSESTGVAKFAQSEEEGFLKVSFFRPFYGSYVVFYLDDDYQRAYVAGNDRDYLWFLSRTPVVTDAQREAFVDKARQLGFPVDELIFVNQQKFADL